MVAVPELLTEAMMARKTERPALAISEGQRSMLCTLARSQTAPIREVQRAQILLHHEGSLPLAEIAGRVGVSHPTVYKCIDKALGTGVESALRDCPRRGREPEISDGAKAWVAGLACRKPKELGLAAEAWKLSALARHVREQAEEAGFPRLSGTTKMTVWRILDGNELKPHRIRYCLERRDPDFDGKMQEVLMVCREVSLQAETPGASGEPAVYSVSVDEKPGIQALGAWMPTAWKARPSALSWTATPRTSRGRPGNAWPPGQVVKSGLHKGSVPPAAKNREFFER
ncbi:MAG: helix-turn-helix domain-containing protein [Gammaproteobacteria bacterium]|nr:helix-turn-helix domain-containing protein [Gammaproteobacteria bacterium]